MNDLQLVCLEDREHEEEPLERREVGLARHPVEMEGGGREALLPAVVDDPFHDGGARRHTNASANEHARLELEHVLRGRAVRRIHAEERQAGGPDHLAQRAFCRGCIARGQFDLPCAVWIEQQQVLRDLVRPRVLTRHHADVHLEHGVIGRRGDGKWVPLVQPAPPEAFNRGALQIQVVPFHVPVPERVRTGRGERG